MSLAMPSRSSTWSSTESTRITISHRLLAEQSQREPPPEFAISRFAISRFAISNRPWDAQIDLRAARGAAPDVQFRAGLPGALPHAIQTVVAGAARFHDVGRDTLPVISNAQPEEPLAIGNFRFDAMRPGMIEGIAQRFASDAVHFVAKDGMQ